MKALTMAGIELRRLVRWRANVFFLFLLPMLLILLLGSAFGFESVRIGAVDGAAGPLARAFLDDLDARPSTEVRRYASAQDLEDAVAHGRVDAGLALPADYDARLRAGRAVVVRYFGRPESVAAHLRATVEAAAADQGRGGAAAQRRVRVALTAPNGSPYRGATGRFERGAATQLLLFVFVNSLSGAAWLIETRRLGIARRVLATPTSARTLVAGQVLGRLAVALVQALLVVVGSLLFFGVDWGDPLGTAAVVAAFCLVATGAAVLLGSVCATEQQAGPVALLLGLGLAALGGSMAPLEIFPPIVRTIAHVTPHAWANDAFAKLLDHGAGLGPVLPQVGVLLAFAAAALTLAVWLLRRTLTAY